MRVIIERRWAGGTVWWNGRRWINLRAYAKTYSNALKCPDTLPIGDGRLMQRKGSEYWCGPMCWATIEWLCDRGDSNA